MVNKLISNWVIQLFCIFWAVFLFLDYINASGYFVKAFHYFEYSGFIVTFFILTFGVAFLFTNRKSLQVVPEIRNFRGIYHYVFVLILMALLMAFYLSKTQIAPNAVSGSLMFIFKSIIFHIGFATILLAALSIGSFLLSGLSSSLDKTTLPLISIALGFVVITMGLFILGAFGLLYQLVVIPFILLLIIPGWRQSLGFVKEVLLKKSEPFQIHTLAVFAYAFMLLLIAIALDFDSRVFPVGFDGLSLYMNTPKLIAGYHGLTQGGDAYNWALMMSLGLIMYNNTLISILISVAPGILCTIVIYKIAASLKLNRNWSIFSCALFYSLPNTIWQSKNDEKTDLAFLFITLCAIILFMGIKASVISSKSKESNKNLLHFSPQMTLWALCGCLIGFSFGIKYVAMLSVFAFLVLIFYKYAGKYGAIAIFFLNFAVIFVLDLTKFAAFERDLFFFRFIVPALIGLIALFFALRKNKQGVAVAGKMAFVFIAASGLTFLPWAIKNLSENKSISIDHMLTGKSPLPELYVENNFATGNLNIHGKHSNILVPGQTSKINSAGIGFVASNENSLQQTEQGNEERAEENNKLSDPKSRNSSENSEKVEEIRRYLGYETGIIRFISLPYDIVMKTNVRLGSADSGILILILLPVFIFAFSAKHFHWNIIKMLLMLFVLIVSIVSVQMFNGPIDFNTVFESMKSSSFSDSEFLKTLFLPAYFFMKQQLLLTGKFLLPVYHYLTIQRLGMCFILIVLFSIALFFIFKSGIAGLDKRSKYLIAFVFCIIQYWLLLSSGIIWYGIAGFSLVPLVIAILANGDRIKSEGANKFITRYVIICTTVWFLLILPFQLVPVKFLYESDMTQIKFAEFMDVPFAKYAIGAQDERQVFKQFFSPAEQNIINALNRDKKANILNISTFLKYHIVNNDSRVYMDNQLGIFKNIASHAGNDRNLIAGEFRKNKIKYILVSLNTDKLDRTPDKSLKKKFEHLMNTMVNNPEVRLLYTNRLVKRPDGDMNTILNGVSVVSKYDVVGERIIDPGTVALFEIL